MLLPQGRAPKGAGEEALHGFKGDSYAYGLA